MWRIKKRKPAVVNPLNEETSFHETHQALLNSLVTIAVAAQRYRRHSAELVRCLTIEEVNVLHILLDLKVSPTLEDLSAHAKQHHLVIEGEPDGQ